MNNEIIIDLVGDAFNGSSESIMPDDYPSDDCGYPAHGIHSSFSFF